MGADRTRDLLLPLAILASVAAGAAMGSLFTRGSSVPAATLAAPPGDTQDLVDALRALRAELARTRELGEAALSGQAGSNRIDASPATAPQSAELMNELRTATAELVKAVEALRSTANRAMSDRAPLVLPARLPDPQILESLRSRTEDEMFKAYGLLTYQQVLDRFGAPLSISHGPVGATWHYLSKSGLHVFFDFGDGHVYQVRKSR